MEPKTRDSLIRRYADGPALIRAALQKVPEAARRWRPGPGRWSCHEIVVHCADAELNAASRIRYCLAEKEPLIAAYDQDRWAVELEYHHHPLEPALALLGAVRANTVPLLRRIPDWKWRKKGRHTEEGDYTPAKWLQTYAEHLEIHARQIERNVKAWEAANPPAQAVS